MILRQSLQVKEITNAELDAFLQCAREQQAYVTNPRFEQRYLGI